MTITAEFTDKVRQFVARVAPYEAPAFDAELRAALELWGGNHADPRLRQVVMRWGGEAVLRADTLTDEELAALDRARAGIFAVSMSESRTGPGERSEVAIERQEGSLCWSDDSILLSRRINR